ncbi:MAG: segregation/condensation protein A [Acidaminobacteraceae bacterium]
MTYEIKLEQFEGPLDLLLHLIKINEVDIYDIHIHKITDQYMEYIECIDVTNMEYTSEFLVMAATLLEIKSKMLLPSRDLDNFSDLIDSSDPRTDLVQKLLDYKKYKEASVFFKEREDFFGRIYYKEAEDLAPFAKVMTLEDLNDNLDRELLMEGLRRVLLNTSKGDDHRSNFFKKLKRDTFTVDEKLFYIKDRLTRETEFTFDSLFAKENLSREEIIVSFLAILELLKLKDIKIKQDKSFELIIIYRNENKEEEQASILN